MKKILLIIACLFFSACSKEDTVVQKQNDITRIEIKSNTNLNGYSLTVLFDTKTGREYLAYSAGGLVEIKPKGE